MRQQNAQGQANGIRIDLLRAAAVNGGAKDLYGNVDCRSVGGRQMSTPRRHISARIASTSGSPGSPPLR
ncbi:hypothetical protein QCD71_12460 [Sphingomonas sp. PsM26]|nr:hypothetical protein [Sphingomonas sp. PsM26]